eukprot:TRINITY_DN4488_c0_g3_i3.p1 TRINITY_DN4488_c0_g3~~TRINITY_DN4488_c0_g3_i3.p1  ORF type:complete len:1086 (+),score=402.73 TRINITY_DN4488_c0_g3_i3:554-3811(+)
MRASVSDSEVEGLVRRCGLQPESLTVEALGLRPRVHDTFHRFDVFSKRAQRARRGSAPVSALLSAFLRHTANAGRHFASIVRPLLCGSAERGPNTAAEYELPIKAGSDGEWDALADWFRREQLAVSGDVRLSICLPRLREIQDHYGEGMGSVADQLRRFFVPLWRASEQRSGALHDLLQHVSTLSLRSEELSGVPELPTAAPADLPAGVPLRSLARRERTPDACFLFYFWQQLARLNEYRTARGLGTFSLRLCCSEPKNRDHLVSAFLLADTASHCPHLVDSPTLTYLFYVCRVGVMQSPLADAATAGSPYEGLPFRRLLRQGIRVSLATADPLHFHRTSQPLLEEYSAAATGFKLSAADLSEAAAHSVSMSRWAALPGHPAVPPSRLAHRHRAYTDELRIIADSCRRLNHAGAAASTRLSQFVSHGHRQTEAYLSKLGRLDINGPPEEEGSPVALAAGLLGGLLELRQRYVGRRRGSTGSAPAADVSAADVPAADVLRDVEQRFSETGVYALPAGPAVPTLADFIRDYDRVCRTCDLPEVLSLALRRLGMLENKFGIHSSLQRLNEAGRDLFGRPVKVEDNRDFYRTVKVDTHVHMAAGMTANDLLDFIRGKVEHQGDDVVRVERGEAAGRVLTLREMMARLGVSDTRLLTVDTLGVQADASVFERFDNFNAKYSPMGEASLRTMFLKTDTRTGPDDRGDVLGGRYFAELCKKTFRRMAPNHYAENRLSIYGRSMSDWDGLAKWFTTHGMSSGKNRWIIQVPRLYSVMRRQGSVGSFADVLRNVFRPLWLASVEPDRHPALDHFLRHISGFDSVDSETPTDLSLRPMPPHQWTQRDNPPYAYWLYFMSANIAALNSFRAARGLSTLSFRPHCGEVGDVRHLAAAFLTADGISHGIELRQNVALQYLYYLARIPLAVSPLSNHSLFLDLERNPFPDFFRRGLLVSLSTDDPLFFHQTQEPLVEEYSIAGKLWRLSSTDLCEIARNSVIMSGFTADAKAGWIGKWWHLDSSVGNDSALTNVPDLRVAFRFETYHDELVFMDRVRETRGFSGRLPPIPAAMLTLEEEDALAPDAAALRRGAAIPARL